MDRAEYQTSIFLSLFFSFHRLYACVCVQQFAMKGVLLPFKQPPGDATGERRGRLKNPKRLSCHSAEGPDATAGFTSHTYSIGKGGWFKISHTSLSWKIEHVGVIEMYSCSHCRGSTRAHGNGCQRLVCLSEPKTTFSVSLAAGMLYNPAGGHRWECHMWAP